MEELKNYQLTLDPLESFELWFAKAATCEENPTAFTLATIDQKTGGPTARILLYKGLDPNHGFKFYSHSHSQKGSDLEVNPQAAMVFYWHNSERQVRVTGTVSKMSIEQTREYFYSRDRNSQLASYISDQSQPIESREALEKLFQQAQEKFKDREQVDLPPHWSGYFLSPQYFEFFVYGAHRLNDRFAYHLEQGVWKINRLQP